MKTILVKCVYCKIEFQKPIAYIKQGQQRSWYNHFCSNKCHLQFNVILKKESLEKAKKLYESNPVRCLNCNFPIPYKDKSWKKYCSKKCFGIHSQRNGGHCHWTEKDKKRLSKLAKQNPNFCGWNKGKKFAEEVKLKCVVCNKEYTQSKSLVKWKNKTKTCSSICRRKIQSSNLIDQYKNGKKVYGGTTKWLKYKDIKVQGSYEYRACKILDDWKLIGKIKNWEYTNDRFEYVGIDGKKHNYLMDFKVWNNDGSFYYLETKGYEKENDKLKWSVVVQSGYKLEIWFEKDIKQKEEFMEVVA